MATIESHQTNFMIVYRLTFQNGLDVIIAASPLSPEVGREVLGGFTEDYTLVGLLRPYSRFYPFLSGIPMATAYIAQQLGIDTPIKELVSDILPLVTIIALPDDILARAERWYNQFYQSA